MVCGLCHPNASQSSHGPQGCTFGLQFGRILSDRIESKRTTTYICASGPRVYSAALFCLFRLLAVSNPSWHLARETGCWLCWLYLLRLAPVLWYSVHTPRSLFMLERWSGSPTLEFQEYRNGTRRELRIEDFGRLSSPAAMLLMMRAAEKRSWPMRSSDGTKKPRDGTLSWCSIPPAFASHIR